MECFSRTSIWLEVSIAPTLREDQGGRLVGEEDHHQELAELLEANEKIIIQSNHVPLKMSAHDAEVDLLKEVITTCIQTYAKGLHAHDLLQPLRR
ncbi:MAG: hypothetical protein L0Y66_21500 [Myxococcaceae bacterium]|nr:hypothetical protein [Myxococcaceae bacterium]